MKRQGMHNTHESALKTRVLRWSCRSGRPTPIAIAGGRPCRKACNSGDSFLRAAVGSLSSGGQVLQCIQRFANDSGGLSQQVPVRLGVMG